MELTYPDELRTSLPKRKRVVGVLCLFSLLCMIIVVIRGWQYLSAIDFLLRQGELGLEELLRTLKIWYWGIILLATGNSIVLAIWYASERHILKILEIRGTG